MKLLCLSALSAGALLLTMTGARADGFTVTIKGQKQGFFHGSAHSHLSKDEILCFKFDYSVISPRDAASGLPTGKRQHKPIMIEKEWSAASPQIFRALVTNENLPTVVFNFYKAGADGTEKVDYRITLTNAFINSFHQHIGDPNPEGTLDTKRYEDVSFTFQKIQIDTAGETAVDDWNSINITSRGKAGPRPS
jgi:type VI secretion system secreted protein Hcp